MTEERVHELTRKHEETIARLEAQEAKAKAQRWTVITSLLAALTAGGGGGFAYFADDAEDDDVKTAVAVHVATAEIQMGDLEDDLDDLNDELEKAAKALAKLQGAIETLSRSNARARREVAGIGELVEELAEPEPAEAPPGVKVRLKPKADRVQRIKESLFAE